MERQRGNPLKPSFVKQIIQAKEVNSRLKCDRTFSHDVKAAILVFLNNETVAILVFQASPVGVELFLM